MVTATLQDGQSGLPTPRSTRSYWHRDPSYVLLGRRSTPELPATADVVVVGSGITGAFAARELVAGGRGVVMLEAREACWGATGRNGGHCQPMIYANKPHIARFELATYRFLEDIVTKFDVPCDWRRVGGVHALPTDELVELVAKRIARLDKHHPDLAGLATLFTDPEDLKRLRVPNAKGAVLQPFAAKCWPYRLVAWVLEALFTKEAPEVFNLQTSTPVTHLQRLDSGSWVVHTPRGQVVAREVLLATNAYTSHLLPKMTGLIVPVRGQVSALEPPDGGVALEHSHLWLAGESDDYLIQRDDPLEMIVVGGERLSVPGGGEGVWSDDEIDDEVAERLRRCLRPALKLRPEGEEEEEELRARWQWTGIMGYSVDGCPFVGRVPGELGGGDGLWVCAGYTGHGMPVAARCAVAVSRMMLGRGGGGGDDDDGGSVNVPEEFLVSVERAERVRGRKLMSSSLEEFRLGMEELEQGGW
ncbi:FAD dependent oxidoreductase domain-containing protein [Trichoderma aethiopicum]